MYLKSFIILALRISCKEEKQKPGTPPTCMFTYDIQSGGDPFDKYDLKGQTNYSNFITAFDKFPWLDEIDKANSNPGNCSPTLSVKNSLMKRIYQCLEIGPITDI